ncbi:MAG TPA: GntR family transcriptional regulator [Solirubrobacteraceae bacterium]|nr:GntR family transcriptional regulator [Solirubrobacteraceae bacterium]
MVEPGHEEPGRGGRSASLRVAIDREAEVPVGLQLGWAICARIRDGSLRPGERLPGLREMAEDSGLNVNTVRSVYQRLERRGLLESQQGSGTFVARAPSPLSAVATIAAEAAREAQATGVDPREVAAALYVAPESAEAAERPVGAGDGTAAQEAGGQELDEAAIRRRALRAQIATLERAIGEIEAEHPGVAPPPAPIRRGAGPALLDAEQLEHVRSGLVRRLATVQAAIDEWSASQAREAQAQPTLANGSVKKARAAHARAPARGQADSKNTGEPDGKATANRPGRPRPTGRPAPAGT